MNEKKLTSKENNLFQDKKWQAFQESYGRTVEKTEDAFGIRQALPFGQSFVWFQKGPEKITDSFINSAKETVTTFVRIEPMDASERDVAKYSLKPVIKGYLLSGQASPKATRVLDLTLADADILDQMKSKTRYNIRLAEKKGVTVARSTDVDAFYDMLVSTSGKKTGYFPHEKAYYQKLIETLGPDDLARIYLAEHEGDALAGILVVYSGKCATYLHGGQNGVRKNLMAPYLCQWIAIREAKERGCTNYDFWGVAETDDPNDPWAGITRFKEGFGGEKIVFPGSFDLVIRPFWYNILTLMAKIRHLVRK